MANEKDREGIEDGFRDALKDAIAIVQRLSPHCRSFEEMLGMMELAVNNDGQLRLVMTVTATQNQPQPQRRSA